MSNPNDVDFVVDEKRSTNSASSSSSSSAACAVAAMAFSHGNSESSAVAESQKVHDNSSSIVVMDEEQKKALRAEILRAALPQCQPQEGSPANTFTDAEIQELQAALPSEMKSKLNLKSKKDHHARQDSCASHSSSHSSSSSNNNPRQIDILEPWLPPFPQDGSSAVPIGPCATPASQQVPAGAAAVAAGVHPPLHHCAQSSSLSLLNWHGAPTFDAAATREPRLFRQRVRHGLFTGPTNGVCPGFLQCNLVVLPAGSKEAFDFLLFCQRNPQACPLLEVCTGVGKASTCPLSLAPEADLRTDCPKYAVYRNGVLEKECTDVTNDWPEEAVAFLIGCSFSYDGALQNAGIPLRSAEQGKNVPMFNTNLACRPAGSLHGTMVVSMKPIPALQVAQHAAITGRYTHAHGGPVCIGRPDAIGVSDINKPDWGDAVDMQPTDVPVFHACGVTPQAVLMASKVPFAITHAAGHMFVTDRPSDMGVV